MLSVFHQAPTSSWLGWQPAKQNQMDNFSSDRRKWMTLLETSPSLAYLVNALWTYEVPLHTHYLNLLYTLIECMVCACV